MSLRRIPLCTVGMILPDVITPRLVVDVREHARALCVHVRRTSTPSAAIRGVTAGFQCACARSSASGSLAPLTFV